ncbi:MAG: O-antigen ligase family protein [Corynebacteriales bacterium]|nr:O-antigen ligase family protein [Mycobacteriales bacterium]
MTVPTGDPLFIFFALAGLVFGIAMFAFPVTNLFVMVGLIPFNGIVSQLLGGGSTALAFGALKDLLLAVLFLRVLMTGRTRSVPLPIKVLVAAVLLVSATAAIDSTGSLQAVYGWRNDYYPLLLLVCVPPLLVDDVVRKRLLVWIAALAQVAAVIAVYTWSRGIAWLYDIGILPVGPEDRFPFERFNAGSITPRAFSPYQAANEGAVATNVIIAAIWCNSTWSVRTRALLTVLPVTMIGLTQSRSGLVGLFLLAAVISARYFHRRIARGLWFEVGIVTLLFATFGGLYYIARQRATIAGAADPSFVGHADSLAASLPKLLANPIGGGLGEVGPRAVRFTQSPVLVESYWLVIGLESGLIVLAMYLAILVFLTLTGLKAGTLVAFTAPAALAGSLVSQMVLPTMQEGAVCYTLWIVVSCGIAAAMRPPPRPTLAAMERPVLQTLSRDSRMSRKVSHLPTVSKRGRHATPD